jgi:cell division ATPase FtsA
LHKIRRSQKLPGGVVLVGGTAKLPGIADFTKEKLRLSTQIGSLRSVAGRVDTVSDPAYAAAAGLMMLDMLLGGEEEPHQHSSTEKVFGFVDAFLGRLRK